MGSGPSIPQEYENLSQPYLPYEFISEKKGLAIDTRTNLPVSCVFCRISEETESEDRALWYRDEYVSVFVPNAPAAMFHFLVIPRHHYPPSTEIHVKDISLLEHMKKVGQMMLEVHVPHRNAIAPLKACQKPPGYDYARGSCFYENSSPLRMQDTRLSVIVDADSNLDSQASHPPVIVDPVMSATSIASQSLLSKNTDPIHPLQAKYVFHVPPFNSIHHLHLHVLAGPPHSFLQNLKYSTVKACVWTKRWDAVVLNLWRKAR